MMNDTWIIYVLAPAATSLITYFLTRGTRKVDITSSLIGLLQAEIKRLDEKVQSLESKIEVRERNEGLLMITIQEAYSCRTPSHKCPVLVRQAYFNRQKISNEKYLNSTTRDTCNVRGDELPGGENTPDDERYEPP